MHLSITARVILHTKTNKGTCINVHTVIRVLLVHQSVTLVRSLVSVHNVTSGLEGDKKFRTSTLLKGHIVQHTGVDTCAHCDKTFSSSVIQQRHIQIHTGEKCHKCFSCDESFSTLSLLRNREMKHGGIKCHHSVTTQVQAQ